VQKKISKNKEQFIKYRKLKVINTSLTLTEFQKIKNKNPKYWNEMKRTYHIRRYNKLDDSLIKSIQPLKLQGNEKKNLKTTPIYKRIGLTKQEYYNNNIIKPHERTFTEEFTKRGYKITWISRIRKKSESSTGYLPTSDFIWNDLEWELKQPEKAQYSNIKNLLKRGSKSGKKNFLIDLKYTTLKWNLTERLARYNLEREQYKIERLYVLDKKGLYEILLK